jgi:hypothetical protein
MVDYIVDRLIKKARKGIYGQNKTVRLEPIRHSKNKKMLYLDVQVPLKNKEQNIAKKILGFLPKKVIVEFVKKSHKKKWIFNDLTWA